MQFYIPSCEWVQNGDFQNGECYKTAKSQNGEITKRRLQQNDDCYKTAKSQTATVTKERKNGDFYKTAKNNIL